MLDKLLVCLSFVIVLGNDCGSTWIHRNVVVPSHFPLNSAAAALLPPPLIAAMRTCETYGRASLEPGCRSHDACYDTCGAKKHDCDSALVDAWIDKCKSRYKPSRWYDRINPHRKTCREACIGASRFMYELMKPFSGTAWEKAQAKCTPSLSPAPARDVLPWLIVAKRLPTASGRLEIKRLHPGFTYDRFHDDVATPYRDTSDAHAYGFTDAQDLLVVHKRGTASGKLEVHVYSASSGYTHQTLQAVTPMHTISADDDTVYDFNVGPNNDLYIIKLRKTGEGTTEVHVLDAASQYANWKEGTRTALHEVHDPNQFAFGVAGNGDVIAIKRFGGAGNTEVHVLDAATRYQSFKLQKETALHETPAPDQFSFAIAPNGDVYAIKRYATGTGTTEVHILDPATEYRTFKHRFGTALHENRGTQFEFFVVP